MSTDKLAETISSGQETGRFDEEAISPAFAAKRVRAEFVVIDRNDLPEVEKVVMRGEHTGTFRFKDSLLERVNHGDDHLLLARAHLAAAEYLDANPPVDEKAVEALAEDLARAEGVQIINAADARAVRQIARRLIADGWKREVGS